MTRKTIITILITLHQTSCLDLNLNDEVSWQDTETASSETPGSSPGGRSDTESSHSSEKEPVPKSDRGSQGGDPPVPDSEDIDAPLNVPISCDGGTEIAGHFCLVRGRYNASLRFQTDEAAEVDIGSPGQLEARILSEKWTRNHWLFFTEVNNSPVKNFQISVEDINGNRVSHEVAISANEGPRVAITEVLADPLGTEPSKEFVEIHNYGQKTIDISGWMIDDNGDRNGDFLPDNTFLSPGETTLIVGPTFADTVGPDPLPPPETDLITLSGTIGSNGLKNSAEESIELYNIDGGLISTYPGNISAPGEGVSIERVAAEIPDGDPNAFRANPQSTSTPGQTPTLNSIAPKI